MLAFAWFRKRLYLGMVIALYGLAVFNLHYWGFGIPFVMAGAWLLVRAYRLQRDLRVATGDLPQSDRASRAAAVPVRACCERRSSSGAYPSEARPVAPLPQSPERPSARSQAGRSLG